MPLMIYNNLMSELPQRALRKTYPGSRLQGFRGIPHSWSIEDSLTKTLRSAPVILEIFWGEGREEDVMQLQQRHVCLKYYSGIILQVTFIDKLRQQMPLHNPSNFLYFDNIFL